MRPDRVRHVGSSLGRGHSTDTHAIRSSRHHASRRELPPEQRRKQLADSAPISVNHKDVNARRRIRRWRRFERLRAEVIRGTSRFTRATSRLGCGALGIAGAARARSGLMDLHTCPLVAMARLGGTFASSFANLNWSSDRS